jgi:hypothetical protein
MFVVSSYPAEGERPDDMPADAEFETLEEARAEVMRRLGATQLADWRRWGGCDNDMEAYHADPHTGCGGVSIVNTEA